MADQASDPKAAGLRRDVSVWGSYMWGFADVGADAFVGLGLVLAAPLFQLVSIAAGIALCAGVMLLTSVMGLVWFSQETTTAPA